jgi:hypothetical protein
MQKTNQELKKLLHDLNVPWPAGSVPQGDDSDFGTSVMRGPVSLLQRLAAKNTETAAA